MPPSVCRGHPGICHTDVQCPPPGPFSHRDLLWCGDHRANPKKCAAIPINRLDDFLQGEGELHSTSFYIRSSTSNEKNPSTKINRASVVWRRVYHCTYGPGGANARDAAQPTRQNAKRRRKSDHGEGKCGCTAHFVAKVLALSPDVVQLQMMEVCSHMISIEMCLLVINEQSNM